MKRLICTMLILMLALAGCQSGQASETACPTQTTPEEIGSESVAVDETAEETLPEDTSLPGETARPEEPTESTVFPGTGGNLFTTEEAPGKIEGEPPEGDYEIPPQPTNEVSDR